MHCGSLVTKPIAMALSHGNGARAAEDAEGVDEPPQSRFRRCDSLERISNGKNRPSLTIKGKLSDRSCGPVA